MMAYHNACQKNNLEMRLIRIGFLERRAKTPSDELAGVENPPWIECPLHRAMQFAHFS
jgi:hypothetical protein